MNKSDKEFYYTNDNMVQDLIAITPLSGTVLDAGSGKNKVWFNSIKQGEKYECEIEDGCDFYTWNKKVNWVIGNPPFHEGWKFMEKALQIATEGIAFLGNISFFNQFTPHRLEIIKSYGFYLWHIRVVSDKRWFGRYYYLIFKTLDKGFLSWNKEVY